MKFDDMSNMRVGCALNVHKEPGPGVWKSAYEPYLCFELSAVGLPFERPKERPVKFKAFAIDCGCRTDILVDEALSSRVLMHFNSVLLREGNRRFVI